MAITAPRYGPVKVEQRWCEGFLAADAAIRERLRLAFLAGLVDRHEWDLCYPGTDPHEKPPIIPDWVKW